MWALLALLVAVAAFLAVLLLGGGSHNAGTLGGGGGSSGGAAVQLQGITNYVPSGSPDTHADTASRATDGDPNTYWYTQTYNTPDFGGLLPQGLGLVLDAGSPVKLAQVKLRTPTPGFVAHIATGDSESGPYTTDSSSQRVSDSTTFTLSGQTARYYVVWITQLPPGGHAAISEVTATS